MYSIVLLVIMQLINSVLLDLDLLHALAIKHASLFSKNMSKESAEVEDIQMLRSSQRVVDFSSHKCTSTHNLSSLWNGR